MPEGPSIVLLKEAVQKFAGKKVTHATGNSKVIDSSLLEGKTVNSFRSFGKQFLICFDDCTVRIHFLLFGSYLVNEEKETAVRLGLKFQNGFVNFYSCSVKLIGTDLDEIYDWSVDVMNDDWNKKAALKKVQAKPAEMICDTLLDQDIFAGVGNIIKNEILFRVGVHPESRNEHIPPAKLKKLIDETRIYSLQFLDWKRQYILKKQWKAHTKTVCPKCGGPIIRKITGFRKRRSFFCERDQQRYE